VGKAARRRQPRSGGAKPEEAAHRNRDYISKFPQRYISKLGQILFTILTWHNRLAFWQPFNAPPPSSKVNTTSPILYWYGSNRTDDMVLYRRDDERSCSVPSYHRTNGTVGTVALSPNTGSWSQFVVTGQHEGHIYSPGRRNLDSTTKYSSMCNKWSLTRYPSNMKILEI
jgi:hypothetical protein